MNPDRFLKDEDVEGIHLSTERPEILHEIRIEIGKSKGGAGFFPGNIPRPLLQKKEEICQLTNPFNTSYAFTLKPFGTRFMLYVDNHGKMYLENEAKQIFEVRKDRIPQLIPQKTILDGVMARKLLREGAELSNNGETQGRLTFVIMDATLVRESEVFRFELEERMQHVKKLIIKPRKKAIEINGSAAFDIDVAKYEPLSYRKYLDPEFKKNYEYNIGSYLFKPTKERYHPGYHYGYQKINPVLEWDTNSCQELTFRLEIITDEGQTVGHLLAIGPDGNEVQAGSIELITDDLKTMGGAIIECEEVDGRWVFVRVRNDREHPKVHLSKLGDIETPASVEYLRDVLRSYYN